MIALVKDILQLWLAKFWFKLATGYILFLILLAFMLDWLPFAYAPNYLDLSSLAVPPFEGQSGHIAGTDAMGRDVMVNTLYGARTGLIIAIPVMLFSCVLGLFVGASSGYFGNSSLKLRISDLLIYCLLIGCFYFYGVYIPLKAFILELGSSQILYSLLLLVVITLVLWLLLRPLLLRFNLFRQELIFPFDRLVLRVIEILTSVPKLILILALASFITPSVTVLSTILILTYWTGTARLARAEMLRIKELPFIEAAKSLGMSHWGIVWKEALPNLAGPVVVTFTFGVAGLLAVEATLSFLGIGLPATTPSWGRLISGIRTNTSAWWLVVIPGSALTLTVLAFQVRSHYLLNSLQEKKRT